MPEIDCTGKETREINREIKAAIEGGEEVVVRNPAARHNLAVGILRPLPQPGDNGGGVPAQPAGAYPRSSRVRIEGSVGYYGAGLCDGVEVEIEGSAGWGLAENLMSGRVMVRGSAGNSAAASIRGGLVVIHGHAAARAGIAMKGGTLVVGGDVGYMSGFMMQKGEMIICGSADEGLGDSIYDGRIFVGGEIAGLGNDAVIEELTEEDRVLLRTTLAGVGMDPGHSFRKVVSGKQLYNFDKREFARWRHAL